ncbi:MAG: TraB/GumN family protein [Allosphingosinicella sp.]
MLKYLSAAVAAAIALASAAPAKAPADDKAQVDDIVVTGRRSGAPLWTVRSDQTTLVLVGAIEGVSKTTYWDPAALTAALRKADRVMFPQAHAFTASPFRLIGWVAKYNAMGSLPKGQSLADFASPETMRRLSALSAKGTVRRDYATRHSLHLSNELRERARHGIDFGRSASDYVMRAVKQYKLTLVPMPRSKAKPIVKDLFASTPQEHMPCLEASVAMAEAGPAAVQARSDAWAARRVPEVLASPADKPGPLCWPASEVIEDGPDLAAEMKQLLGETPVTVAVLNLRSLARPGGVLDELAAAGFDIQGPAWK